VLNLPGLKRFQLPLNGGVDEMSPSDGLAIEDAVYMRNFRLSQDGKRVEKRLGLTEESSFGDHDVYGYATYFDSSAQFCQIAVLDSAIYNKVSSGAWTSLYSFPTVLDHPTNIIEAQGKKFIITEKGSRMIHSDGNCYQIGIDAPTTIPSAAPQYTSAETLVVHEHFADLDDWVDEDSGTGDSSLYTSDPDSEVGPDADTKYLRLTTGAESGTTYAQRHLTPTDSIGSKFTVEFPAYFKSIGSQGTGPNENDAFFLNVFTGSFHLRVMFSVGGVTILDGHDTPYDAAGLVGYSGFDTWKFYVDATDVSHATVKSFKNGVQLREIEGIYGSSSASAAVYLSQRRNTTELSTPPDVYIDSIVIYNISTSSQPLVGTHLYAVTYFRGGDYGCESRATKSYIGAVTHDGYGQDGTLVVTGTYANTQSASVRIWVSATDGLGTDTVQISYDGGDSYVAELKMSSVMYINYGLILTFTNTTTNNYGESWSFDCTVCSADPTSQQVSLTSIPISPDAQTTGRNIYRTTSGGSQFYYLATINDNVTETFVDSIPDTLLGALLEEDHYVCPDGKFSCYWDDRLWVFDHTECLGYYSRINEPEHFNTATGWIAIRRGIPGDDITGVIPYKDSIYVFKPNAIFVIQKNSLLYGVYQLNNDVGCISPGTLVEVNDYLMFRSYRGIEVYDGQNAYRTDFSIPVRKTVNSAVNTSNDLNVAAHNKEYNEVWFTFNDRTTGGAATVVWNYLRNKWYTFAFTHLPSCLSVCRDSTKKNVLKMGSRAGYVYLCDSGYLDGASLIPATYRKGWVDLEKHGNLRRIDVEYELNTGYTLTANVYVDMDKDVFRTYALTGVTPSSTDREYRRPIIEKFEVGGRAKWFSIEFTNAEELNAPLKINDCFMYVRQDVHKNKKYSD